MCFFCSGGLLVGDFWGKGALPMADWKEWDVHSIVLNSIRKKEKRGVEEEEAKEEEEGDGEVHGARWYHAAFHLTTAMVGAGVLGLPNAFAALTWIGGTIVMVVALCATFLTATLLSWMHIREKGGRRVRLPTLHAVVLEALGETAAHVMRVFQVIIFVGTGIAYTILTGDMIRSMILSFSGSMGPALMIWFAIFIAIEFVLALAPNLHNFRWTSFAALIFSCAYCGIAVVLCIILGRQPDASYALPEGSMADQVRAALESLGLIAFAYGGHSIMVEVENTLRSEPDPRKEMFRGICAAFGVLAVLYFAVAFSGYAVFGNRAQPNILKGLQAATKDLGIEVSVAIAQCLVILHVVFGFQVYMMPLFDLIDTRWPPRHKRSFVMTLLNRALRRWPILALQWLIASSFPFFGDILALIGAVATTTLSLILPSLMYLSWMHRGYERPRRALLLKCVLWTIVVVFFFVGVAAAAASIWNLVTRTTFNFFQ